MQGQDFCSAQANGSERESGRSRLFPTGKKIYSITSQVDVYKDSAGSQFFVKGIQYEGKELAQLVYLDSIGIRVPNQVLVDRDFIHMATPFAGFPLSEVVRELHPREQNALYRQAGVILRAIHERVKTDPPPEEVIVSSYHPSAHIVDNLFHKHIGGVTIEEYASHKKGREHGRQTERKLEELEVGIVIADYPFIPIGEGPAELRSLLGFANQVASHYLERLAPHVVLSETSGTVKSFLNIPDTDIFHGDYKPDNLLVREKGEDAFQMTVIDPIMSRGSRYFDVAKFSARYLLESPNYSFGNNLAYFFDGYGERPGTDEPVYGELTILNLMQMDILNTLKSYSRRHFAGNNNYRLVAAMGNPEFCEQTAGLLVTLEEGRLL